MYILVLYNAFFAKNWGGGGSIFFSPDVEIGAVMMGSKAFSLFNDVVGQGEGKRSFAWMMICIENCCWLYRLFFIIIFRIQLFLQPCIRKISVFTCVA